MNNWKLKFLLVRTFSANLDCIQFSSRTIYSILTKLKWHTFSYWWVQHLRGTNGIERTLFQERFIANGVITRMNGSDKYFVIFLFINFQYISWMKNDVRTSSPREAGLPVKVFRRSIIRYWMDYTKLIIWRVRK